MIKNIFLNTPLGVNELQKVNEEKDIGVVIDSSLKFEIHVVEKIKKANRMIGLIKRNFNYVDKNTFLTLYKALVRPHILNMLSVSSLHTKKMILSIENVQRRATKVIKNIKHLTYKRLRYHDLPTLVYRRSRGDTGYMIETYRIVNGKYDIAATPYLQPCKQRVTRGNSLKLAKIYSRLNVRSNFFSLRITNLWNSLTEDIVSAPRLIAFENRLDKYWKNTSFKFEFQC